MKDRPFIEAQRKMYLTIYLVCTVIITLSSATTPTSIIKTVTQCDPGWIKANGMCYYWNDLDQVTFDEAHDECHARGSDMLIIHSSSEQEWLTVQTESYPTTGWWIGLKKQLTPTPQWRWLDNSIASNINWNTEPDNYDIQACVNINQFNKFSDDFCTSKYPYICKLTKKEDEYCPTATTDERWAYLMYACYWIADPANPAEFLTWSDAKAKCQTLNPIGSGTMHLLSVTSGMEREFFSSELPYRAGGVSTPWWTGLNDIDNKDFYTWEDGNTWNSSMTPWDNSPSNGSDENCAIMYRAGVVDDFQCGGRSHFICQKSATTTELSVGCPEHWIRGGHSCYLFANHSESTWSQARSVCKKGGGDLLKQDTADKKYWISHQIIPTRGYWTGLNDRDTEGDYRWADGTKLDTKFIQWDTEPNSNVKDADCGLIARDGTLDDVSCTQKQGYICEYVNDPGNKCLPGWISDGGSNCYYFSSTNITSLMMWTEVNQACLDQVHQYDEDQQAGYLCFDSKDEVAFINKQLANQPITYRRWWTGLNDRTIEGEWTWQTDYDALVNTDLINWNKEPNNYNNEDCTILYQGGKYNDLDCNAEANYICEKTAGSSKFKTKWWIVFLFYIFASSLS